MNAALTAAARAAAPSRAGVDVDQPRLPAIGGWQLMRLLAEGRYTRSYRAKPLGSDERGLGDFLLKIARSDVAAPTMARAVLRREAVVSRMVRHEHLASVLVDRTADERPHLVLPYVESVTAAQLLEACLIGSSGCELLLPLAVACSVVRQVALAAVELHARGWVHSRIGFASVTIARDGHATLGELGEARRSGSVECQSRIDEPTRIGPPETLVAHGCWSPASDVYDLGLLLFELATHRSPFQASNPAALARLHREQAPPELREFRPTASRELAELVRRMLAKEPLRRPAAPTVARWLAEIEIAELATGDSFGSRIRQKSGLWPQG